jgi:organic hydroperoxide reductase OsmC/OhrA
MLVAPISRFGTRSPNATPSSESSVVPHLHKYHVRSTWTGARVSPTTSYEAYSREHVAEVDGKPALRCTADPMFRGDASLHNPEDLFLTALSGCHMLTYLALAARAGISVTEYVDDAIGTMELVGGGGHFAEVMLRPRVTIAPGSDASVAMRLHDQAHKDCFIASSTNFPVRHEATVVVATGFVRASPSATSRSC